MWHGLTIRQRAKVGDELSRRIRRASPSDARGDCGPGSVWPRRLRARSSGLLRHARRAATRLHEERFRPEPRVESARRRRWSPGRRREGASSRITWAFVPLKPKELTPARRGQRPTSPTRQCGVDRNREFRPRDARIRHLIVRVRRSASCWSDSTTLSSPQAGRRLCAPDWS